MGAIATNEQGAGGACADAAGMGSPGTVVTAAGASASGGPDGARECPLPDALCRPYGADRTPTHYGPSKVRERGEHHTQSLGAGGSSVGKQAACRCGQARIPRGATKRRTSAPPRVWGKGGDTASAFACACDSRRCQLPKGAMQTQGSEDLRLRVWPSAGPNLRRPRSGAVDYGGGGPRARAARPGLRLHRPLPGAELGHRGGSSDYGAIAERF